MMLSFFLFNGGYDKRFKKTMVDMASNDDGGPGPRLRLWWRTRWRQWLPFSELKQGSIQATTWVNIFPRLQEYQADFDVTATNWTTAVATILSLVVVPSLDMFRSFMVSGGCSTRQIWPRIRPSDGERAAILKSGDGDCGQALELAAMTVHPRSNNGVFIGKAINFKQWR